MAHPDAIRWNARYQRESLIWLERPPRQLLLDHAHLLPSQGLALDVAAGVANNACFLAEHGLQVIALDVSDFALQLARQRADERKLNIHMAIIDLTEAWLPAEHFEVILNFLFFARPTIWNLRRALKPGGVLFLETFQKNGLPLKHPEHYMNPGEAREIFQGFEILHWSERKIHKRGNPHYPRTLEQLIVRKPH
jgi:SAM-dependent methyltransferase